MPWGTSAGSWPRWRCAPLPALACQLVRCAHPSHNQHPFVTTTACLQLRARCRGAPSAHVYGRCLSVLRAPSFLQFPFPFFPCFLNFRAARSPDAAGGREPARLGKADHQPVRHGGAAGVARWARDGRPFAGGMHDEVWCGSNGLQQQPCLVVSSLSAHESLPPSSAPPHPRPRVVLLPHGDNSGAQLPPREVGAACGCCRALRCCWASGCCASAGAVHAARAAVAAADCAHAGGPLAKGDRRPVHAMGQQQS